MTVCSTGMQAAALGFSGGCDEDGCYHGSTCTLETKAGAVCSGRLHHGFLHGRVEMHFPDGFEFEGFMHENQLTGEAVLKHKSSQYHGEVAQGAAEGLGSLTLGDQATYEGTYQHQLSFKLPAQQRGKGIRR